MKKIISVLTAVVLLAAFILPGTVLAAGDPTFAVSSASAKAGSDAEIKISVKNNPGIASAKFEVTFDGDLTLQKVAYGDDLGGMPQMPDGLEKGLSSPVTLNWFNALSNMTADTDYATLTFKVADTAASGEHKIEISYDEEDVFNLAEKNIKFKIENGVINVTGGAPADDKSDSATGSSVGATTDSGDTTTIGASDEGPGDYTGPEIEFDEDGNVIDEDEATVGAESSGNKNYIIICAAAVAVLLIVVALVLTLRKKQATVAEPEEQDEKTGE